MLPFSHELLFDLEHQPTPKEVTAILSLVGESLKAQGAVVGSRDEDRLHFEVPLYRRLLRPNHRAGFALMIAISSGSVAIHTNPPQLGAKVTLTRPLLVGLLGMALVFFSVVTSDEFALAAVLFPFLVCFYIVVADFFAILSVKNSIRFCLRATGSETVEERA